MLTVKYLGIFIEEISLVFFKGSHCVSFDTLWLSCISSSIPRSIYTLSPPQHKKWCSFAQAYCYFRKLASPANLCYRVTFNHHPWTKSPLFLIPPTLSLIKRKHCRLQTRHWLCFANNLAPPCILVNLIQFPSVKCDLCHPEYSSSSWRFCGWSGRSPEGTTAATGRRRRNTWCCVSAVSRSTSSWTSSTSSSLTRDYRSLQMVF